MSGRAVIAIAAAIVLAGCGDDGTSPDQGQPPGNTGVLIRERTAPQVAPHFTEEGFRTIVRLQALGAQSGETWRRNGPGPGATKRVAWLRVPRGVYVLDALAIDTFASPRDAVLAQCSKGVLVEDWARLVVTIVHDLRRCRITLGREQSST